MENLLRLRRNKTGLYDVQSIVFDKEEAHANPTDRAGMVG